MGNPNRVRMLGPLTQCKDGLVAELHGQGYTRHSSSNLVRLMAHLSRWMDGKGLHVEELTADRMEEFLRHRRRAGYTHFLTRRALAPIVGYLRRAGIAPTEEQKVPEQNELTALLADYEAFLIHERSLSPGTVRQRQDVARHFLSICFDEGNLDLDRLTAADVSSYILREARISSVSYAKLKVAALRSLLRYMYVRGDIANDLSGALPAIAGWRLVGLPRALTPEETKKLLHACDRRTRLGRRAYAVVLLMIRLGLRVGEAAALSLDDFDWSRGEMVVRGKGGRQDALPLPQGVGEAIVSYLRLGRPHSKSRHLFLSIKAPSRDATPNMLKQLLRTVGDSCGIPCLGAHRLRHTAATMMLRNGASLPEIGQVLRHRSVDTSAIYAKVDRNALRALSCPWPEATR